MTRDIQTDLKSLGFYHGVIDNSYGNMTKTAVKQFQAKYGLAVDGSAGYNTQAKMLEVLYGVNQYWKDKQTLVIEIPMPRLDIFSNTQETVLATFNRIKDKPLFATNGTLFSGNKSMGYVADNGNVDMGVMSKYIMWDTGSKIDVTGAYYLQSIGKVPQEAIGASPLLAFDGKIKLDLTGFDRNLVNTKHPRIAYGIKDNKLIIVVVHGRRSWKGHYGCTIPELANLMLSLGCKHALAEDGGGSIMVVNRYGKIVNQPTSYRRVENAIALYPR